MLRCIGVVYATLTTISGFIIRDDETKHFRQLSESQVVPLIMQHRVINLYIKNSHVLCRDCALSKLAKYTESGFYLGDKPVYQLVARDSANENYIALINSSQEIKLSKEQIHKLVLQHNVYVCNVYLSRDNQLVINNAATLLCIDATPKQVVHKPARRNRSAIFQYDISREEFLEDRRYREGIVLNFAMSLGFSLDRVIVRNIDTERYALYLYLNSRDKAAGREPIATFSLTFSIYEDISVTYALISRNKRYNTAFLDLFSILKDNNKGYLFLNFESSPSENSEYVLLDAFESSNMDDSYVPEQLQDFLMRLSSEASQVAPLSFSNIPSKEYIAHLYSELCIAASKTRDVNRYVELANLIWHHKILITALGLRVELEVPLAQICSRDELLLFTGIDIMQDDAIWGYFSTNFADLLQGDSAFADDIVNYFQIH